MLSGTRFTTPSTIDRRRPPGCDAGPWRSIGRQECGCTWSAIQHRLPTRTAKAKAYNTNIAPQAAYGSCSGAFVSQTERAYSLYAVQSMPAFTEFDLQPNSHRQPWSSVYTKRQVEAQTSNLSRLFPTPIFILAILAGRSGLVVTRLPAAREDPGSNRAAGRSLCFHENHCDMQLLARAAHWLQCLGRLSLRPSEGR